MTEKPKSLSRVLTQTESRHLFDQFEVVHCQKEVDGVTIRCPGWDPNLLGTDETGNAVQGGCKYKNSYKLCTNLQAAANGTLVIEIRPRTEEDSKKESDLERAALNAELKKMKGAKAEIEEQILALESKIRDV